MRRHVNLFPLVLISLLSACSPRPGSGRTGDGGNDVVQPLWTEQSASSLPADTVQCTSVVALLIGIGHYDPANGWETLSAGNDLSLMTATLRRGGVKMANIHLLTNQQATKTGIENALQLLADTLPKGTELILLYAGHARQLPDDTGDETDGYDEAIVPYDAPPASQTQPNAYLRDDELNRYLTRIRATLGPEGSLWLLFDACHSQTLNRGQLAQHIRGGIAPMGPPATSRFLRPDAPATGSDWYESPAAESSQLAPYVLFAATTEGGPNFETVDALGRSLGPLTRAVCEVWADATASETYRTLFNRVAIVMARYAPYQQPGLEGNADRHTPGCGTILPDQPTGWRTIGEPLRVDWPSQDAVLTRVINGLPFVQRAGAHADLRIDRRNRGYRIWNAANDQISGRGKLSAEACVERIRQYFARNTLLHLQQNNPDFRVTTVLQRIAVRTESGRTVMIDTLPALTSAGLPTFRVTPNERMLLTLTNSGSQPAYLTVVDLQPDGTLHVLLPGEGQSATGIRLQPGQSMQQRIRITDPVGAEVYKILLTPEPIDLRSVLQTRGNAPARHPYEVLFQRTYTTRGLLQSVPLSLSDKTGATAEVTFWVKKF